MLRLPKIEDDTLQRLMSERILSLMECHSMVDGDLTDGEGSDIIPAGMSYERANEGFIALRKLLKSDEALTPELLGEYLMYKMILLAIKMDAEEDPNPWLHLASARFPEKERAELVEKLGEETVEEYEDLRNYEETLFWDLDFLMLDSMTEREILASPLNEAMGIMPGMMLDLDGKQVAFQVRREP